jgi:Tfp pilus assembly protein PilF
VNLSPKDVEFRVKYGTALARIRPQAALLELRQAVELDPDNYVAHQALGTTLRRVGDLEGSTVEFQRATELSAAADKHTEAVVHTNRGIEFLKMGSIPQAIEALQMALAAQGDLADAHHYLAIAHSAVSNWRQANQAFEVALQKKPSDPEIPFNFGVALGRQGDWQGAVHQFSTVVRIRPSHLQAHCWLADALSRLGENERSRIELEQARELGTCQQVPPR